MTDNSPIDPRDAEIAALRAKLRETRRESGKVCDRLHLARIELELYKVRARFAESKVSDDNRYGKRMLWHARELMTAIDPTRDADGPFSNDLYTAMRQVQLLRTTALAVNPTLLDPKDR